eukprot:4248122-Karenia_brevis.AAC.1
MPHSGYADHFVQEVYDHLAAIVQIARKEKRLVVLAGDWNAELASVEKSGERKQMIGQFGNHAGNLRGDWLR